MTTTGGGTRFFQFYLDNYFKFPKEIKNDIIYCQRALKAHIKVHQLVVEKLKPAEDKRRVLEELETEIYEINAEQHYLLLRLRRVIDEFYKSLQRGGMLADSMITNQLISKEIVPHIEDASLDILPVSVLFRNTEEKLIEKYFPIEEEEQASYGIFDKSEDYKKTIERKHNAIFYTSTQQQLSIKNDPTNGTAHSYGTTNASNAFLRNGSSNHLSQVSLLKPMSQRMVGGAAATKFGVRSLYAETTNNVQVNVATFSRSTPNDQPPQVARNLDTAVKDEIKQEPDVELPVSKNVTLSRLNLRQALKKAKTETLAAAKATANILTKPAAQTAAPPITCAATSVRPATVASTATSSSSVALATGKTKTEMKLRAAKAVAIANSKSLAAAEFTSSSEDSTGERGVTPPHVFWPREAEENKTLPEDYGQEMFLRLFGLFTPEMHVQMQQRRSKRRRRTVYNNERADFHYGRYENAAAQAEEKKRRKAFLLSPQIKRGLQTRKPPPPKRTVIEKNSESCASRSSSSSPDEKRACNECLKGGGSIDKCEECKGFYHHTCHTEDTNAVQSKRSLPVDHIKLCPACTRAQLKLIKNEAKQYEALKNAAQELEKKMAKEKHRRASLQHKSKMHKIQMRNLFNIVRTIKSDSENDSSD